MMIKLSAVIIVVISHVNLILWSTTGHNYVKCNFNNTHYPLLTVGRCHGSVGETMTVQRRHLIKCQTSVSTLNTKCKMSLLFIEWMIETSSSQLFVILIKHMLFYSTNCGCQYLMEGCVLIFF